MPSARPLLLVAGALAAAAVATACGPEDVTAPRLDRAVAETFTHLYGYQQQLLGTPAAAAQGVNASCTKAGGGAQVGAGDGWTCTIDYVPASTILQSVTYDLAVQADGCFHATGPPGVVGTSTERTADGSTRTNPLYAFDGCFDTTS